MFCTPVSSLGAYLGSSAGGKPCLFLKEGPLRVALHTGSAESFDGAAAQVDRGRGRFAWPRVGCLQQGWSIGPVLYVWPMRVWDWAG